MAEGFTDNDIRPEDLKEGQWEAQQKDIGYLQGIINNFVEISCPACAGNKWVKKFEKFSFQFVSCVDCGTLYMNPRASQEDVNKFYAQSHVYDYWNKYIFPVSNDQRRKKIFVPRVKRVLDICKKYNVNNDLLVEVGAGYGFFMQEMENTHYFKRLIAIEPFHDLAQHCRSVGVEVIEEPIEKVDLKKENIDIIVSFEVIEHLYKPESFIKSCFEALNSGGVLILSCPNYKGFDISLMQKFSDSIDEEHINLFTPESIKVLLEKVGFKLIEISTPGELDAEIVRNKILKGEFVLEDEELKKILIDQWEDKGRDFQENLKNNKKSSHMWTVVQKP